MTFSAATATLMRMPPVDLDEIVAGNVRAHRARLRLTQQQLADELDWPRTSVMSLENQQRRVTLTDVADLCRVLKIDLAELLRGAERQVLKDLGLG